MSVSYWVAKNSKLKKIEADICIVGAGISGLSTAYWLQKEDPTLKVVILEKGTIGSGASGRNAGFITCGSVEHFNRMVSKYGEDKALEIWRFAEENMSLLKQYILGPGKVPSFRQQGAFSLAAQSSEFAELQSVANLMKSHKIPVEVLKQEAIEKRLGAEGFVGGIKYKNDGEVNPLELVRGIKSSIETEIYENCEVASVDVLESGQRRVVSSSLQVDCSLVIYCCNGYSAALSPYFLDKIYPTRGQIMMLEPVAPFMEGPCYANFYLDYLGNYKMVHF